MAAQLSHHEKVLLDDDEDASLFFLFSNLSFPAFGRGQNALTDCLLDLLLLKSSKDSKKVSKTNFGN